MTRPCLFAIIILLLNASAVMGEVARGRQAMVATVHPLATDAGMRAFRDGGNAVDAAIAAALMLGVVDGHNSGLGGGCFILIRQPDGTVLAIDGREMAPKAAFREMFIRDGVAVPELSQTGPLAIATPGALAAYELALSRAGRLQLAPLLLSAAEVAEQGFAIDRIMARNLRHTAPNLARFPASRKIFLTKDNRPYRQGEILVQQDLASTYRQIAKHGISWFYGGPFAQRVERWMASHGGLLTADDFRNYQVRQREPIVTQYRGHTIIGFPPPSSGGIHVAQILNTLENFDLRQLHQEDPTRFAHVITESMKLAFADRAYWLGDADFVDVPRGLIDKPYANQLAARIDLDQATPVPGHGTPDDWQTKLFKRHTTHISAADAQGYWVGITATINTSFGSKVVVPGTGVVMNNEMDDFSSQPGRPNAFGLVGNENNAVAANKRPLSSMSPTIVVKDGQPVLTLGAAGGPKIITQVVLGIVHYVDLQWPVARCVGRPRWHHQWRPDRLFVEASFPDDLLTSLERLGHESEYLPAAGVMQAIARTDGGVLIGVSDPRVPGKASGL